MRELAQQHSLIRASAGSGKTFALSNQFIAILVRGESPERILATTFTKKAAGEIRDRIFLRLAEAALSSEHSKELGFFIGVPKLSPDDAKEALRTLIQAQHKLAICTLDSFFSTVARNFAFEIGLSPGWSLQDPRHQAFEQDREIGLLLEELEVEVVDTLLKFLFRGDAKALVRKHFLYRLRKSYEAFRETAPEAWSWLPSSELLEQSAIASLIKQVQELPVPPTKAGKPNKQFQKGLVPVQQLLLDRAWRSLLDATLVQKVLLGESSYNRVAIPDEMRDLLSQLGGHAVERGVKELENELQSLYHFLRVLDATRIEEAKRRGVLNFADVKYFLLDANAHEKLDTLYYRLDTQFKHIMLDEFQDTSMIEWRLVEPLVTEVVSKHTDEGNSFFCVGDVKQAIYGWRGGVAEIFDTLQSNYPQLTPTENNSSYRCPQVVLDFVNDLFLAVPDLASLKDFPEVCSAWKDRFHAHTAAGADRAGYVAIHSTLNKQADSELEVDDYYEQLSEQLTSIISEYPSDARVGILLRGNADIPEIVYHLRQQGLDASGTQSAGICDSHAIVFILHMLKLIEHPTDINAWEMVCRSELGECFNLQPGATMEQRLAELVKLRNFYYEHGLQSLLQHFYETFREHVTTHDIRRVRHLMHECRNIPGLSGLRLVEIISYIKQIDLPEGNDSRVSVMSIHKSKGLEFDVVILPELHKEIVSFNKEYLFAIREQADQPISKVLPRTKEILRQCRPELQAVYDHYANARLNEELSVLYVALTRAKSAVHLLLPELGEKKSNKLSFASIIREAFNFNADADAPVLYEQGVRELSLKQKSKNLPKNVQSQSVQSRWGLCVDRPEEARRAVRFSSESEILAMASGTKVHSEFELIEWGEEGLSPESQRLLDSTPALKALFLRERYSASEVQVFREARFGVGGKTGPTQLQIDRLVISYEGGVPVRAEIIDFKTDTLGHEFVESYAERYRSQLEGYRSVVAGFTGLPTEAIDLSLVFVDSNAVVNL